MKRCTIKLYKNGVGDSMKVSTFCFICGEFLNPYATLFLTGRHSKTGELLAVHYSCRDKLDL